MTGCALHLCQHQKRLGNMSCLDLLFQQIACHVVRSFDAARTGPRCDELVGDNAGPNPVRIHSIHPDMIRTQLKSKLAHQEQCRGLWQTIGPEITSRIYRLLADVEKQLATPSLPEQAVGGGAGKTLGRKEVQVIGIGKLPVIQFQHGAGLCRAGIRDHDIKPTKTAGRGHYRTIRSAILSDVNLNRKCSL